MVVLAALALPGSAEATSLNEVKKLTASDAQANDLFGRSVAVSGDTAVVGALREDAGGSLAGAGYVFHRDQGGTGNWGEVKKITASDAQAEDRFGVSVAVSGDTAVVGAWLEDAGGTDAGAAYVFHRDQGGAGNWGEVKKLTASDAHDGDGFGNSTAVSGDTVVVGAIWEDAGGSFAGAAYVFQRNEGGADNWGEVRKLTASDVQAVDNFGGSVAVSGDTAIVSATFEDAGGEHASAAYVFDLLAIKSTPTGDVNCDDTVDSIDASLALQFNASLLGSLTCAGGADVNDDGRINSIDAALILQFVAGLLPGLPPPPRFGI